VNSLCPLNFKAIEVLEPLRAFLTVGKLRAQFVCRDDVFAGQVADLCTTDPVA